MHRLSTGHLITGDATDVLAAMAPEVADVVFLDPPFNLGKSYGKRGPSGDRLSEDEYSSLMSLVFAEAIRVLRPGGALWLYHVPRWSLTFGALLSKELQFQHWIAVAMKNGFARGARLYPAHYALLHFTKGHAAVMRRPKIAPPVCRHCGEYVRDYGGYAEFVRNGINLSDVWDDISPVRHRKYKTRSANELPLVIGRRVVSISGKKGGLLVDPFAGSGTLLVAARLGGMRYVGCDREPENVEIALERLRSIVKSGGKADD